MPAFPAPTTTRPAGPGSPAVRPGPAPAAPTEPVQRALAKVAAGRVAGVTDRRDRDREVDPIVAPKQRRRPRSVQPDDWAAATCARALTGADLDPLAAPRAPAVNPDVRGTVGPDHRALLGRPGPAPAAGKCQNRRTFRWYQWHNPNPATGRCRRCGAPSSPYDRHADWYDRHLHGRGAPTLADTIAIVRRLLHPLPRTSLLDLGCGPGLVSGAIVPDGWHVTGIDASAPLLAHADPRLPQIVHASATQTGLPAGSAEVILSTWTHTDIPWAELVDEAARLLQAGGSFIYAGGDPKHMPPPSPDGVRTRVGARVLTRPELLAPLAGQWNIETITTAAAHSVPMLGWRATRR